jgi:putative flippase GtrA
MVLKTINFALVGVAQSIKAALVDSAVRGKVVNFARIGVVNTAVDAAVFFLADRVLTSWLPAVETTTRVVGVCHCGTPETVAHVIANTISWYIAVSGSYVLTSNITFAVESGRRLRFAAYGMYVMSGVIGYLANTTTLVIVAQFLPVWVAKGCAIVASFVVNFSMSHFVVFRPRRPGVEDAR